MDMVMLYSKEDYEGLMPDGWGIPSVTRKSVGERKRCLGDHIESTAKTEEQKSHALDVVVMPGVAFDTKLQRLGHGKGFYDRFLARYSESESPKKRKPFLGQ